MANKQKDKKMAKKASSTNASTVSSTPVPPVIDGGAKNEKELRNLQAETNRLREQFIASLTPAQQKSFATVEKAVADLEGADVPFMLFTNPLGYGIREEGKSGFWRYQRFHALNKQPYDPETINEYQHQMQSLVSSFVHYFSIVRPDLDIQFVPKVPKTDIPV